MRFRVGDRVRAIEYVAGTPLKGRTGTVVHIHNTDDCNIGVEFDKPFGSGHSCGGHGIDGYCRYGYMDEFELIEIEAEADFEFSKNEIFDIIDV